MTYVANRIPTADRFPATAQLRCPGSVRINIDVEAAHIYYQLGDSWPAPQWRDEIALPPGFRSLDQRADAVRVRSAAPGQPAIVTIAAYPLEEIGGG
ncbi:MAG TPA: hypothetical protein VMY78_09870 [Solirubrobacteraceae bacterium]|nr:hypothetical protein [Solirubrobacteraceae bacterium]